ncbi:MAG: hypothetical protein ACE5H1_02980, partial [Thermodesulfobacteriota bacterium]
GLAILVLRRESAYRMTKRQHATIDVYRSTTYSSTDTYIINPNDKYADRIIKAQEEAKLGRKGIWGDLYSLEPPGGNYGFLIKPSNASRYIDQRVVVRGKISKFRKSDKVLVLKMEGQLDIVLFPGSLSNFRFFNIKPEEYYMGKPAEVIGKVKMYKGRPNIIVNHPISIRALM